MNGHTDQRAEPMRGTSVLLPTEPVSPSTACLHGLDRTFDHSFWLDSGGAVRWTSGSIAPLLGFEPAEFQAADFLTFVHPDDRDTVRAARAGLRAGRPARFRLRVRHRDGGHRCFVARLVPTYDEGRPAGAFGLWDDITEQIEGQVEGQIDGQIEGPVDLPHDLVRSRSALSHDLRTPLNAVLGFAQILESDDRPVVRSQAEKIHAAGMQLLRLVEGMLEP